MCAQARTVLADIDQELAAMGPGDAAWKGVEVAEEQAERRQIATSRRVVAEQLEQRARLSSAALARLDSTLAALPLLAMSNVWPRQPRL
jgi:exonuclease SbcC